MSKFYFLIASVKYYISKLNIISSLCLASSLIHNIKCVKKEI